jgi:hypothetical protein
MDGGRILEALRRANAEIDRLRAARDDAEIDRALDRLEAELVERRGNPNHVKSGEHGGEFTSGSGTGGGAKTQVKHTKKRKKPVRKRNKVARGYKDKSKPKGGPKDEARMEAAKKSHKRTARAEKDYAKANEHKFANHIGGKSFPDNDPSDVDVNVGGKNHHLELKSMLTSEKGQVNVARESIGRKVAKSQETKRPFHIVVLDDRDVYNAGASKGLHSGNRMYFKSGVARYNIKDMHPVKDEHEIRALLATPYDQWPAKAKPSKNAVAGMNAKWIDKS